ncbi:glycoside hydrolase family 32 protein [Alkalibacterium sp. f15]|uniref:glycoside hydrolase family 32 protein n=1 Tax=Alkalibacterium sp. f15 TaxID=3414029 RepID=UPI003BF830FE
MKKSNIKYRKYHEIPEEIIQQAEEKTKNSPYLQSFHIEPNSGYLNDPNGFSYYNGKYHMFYQWSPLRYLKEPERWYQGWYHLESKDMVHWISVGVGLEPDTKFDSHGPYSGSAMVDEDKLLIFYTGNTRDNKGIRTPYQMIAIMDKNGKIQKSRIPGFTGLIDGYTDHFRDPKIWKENNTYYAVVGIQRENKTGASVILKSKDAVEWELAGEIRTDYPEFGYMWECPDYFKLQGQGVLLFSPQGLKAQGAQYQNIYQSGYLVGETLDLENLTFNHESFQELDSGFDFYATQTMDTNDGRRILSAWMGMPEIEYPTEAFGYCGCLTIPRELSLKNNELLQTPIKELQKLRCGHRKTQEKIEKDKVFKYETGSVFEIDLTIEIENAKSIQLSLRSDEKMKKKTVVFVNPVDKDIILDRSNSGKPFGTEYGTTRKIAQNISNKIRMRIFVDKSSIEVFVNDGENVASSRIFPGEDQKYLFVESIGGTSTIKMDYWKLRKQRE